MKNYGILDNEIAKDWLEKLFYVSVDKIEEMIEEVGANELDKAFGYMVAATYIVAHNVEVLWSLKRKILKAFRYETEHRVINCYDEPIERIEVLNRWIEKVCEIKCSDSENERTFEIRT